MALLIGVLGAAVVLTGGVLLVRGMGTSSRSDTSSAAAASTGPASTGLAPAGQTPATSPEDQDPVTGEPVSNYPDVSITGQECGRADSGPYAAAAAGNDRTSCPFAVNVQRAYVMSNADGAAIELEVYSPRTGKLYAMSCSGDQPVTCQGGDDAVVYLYGGRAVVP